MASLWCRAMSQTPTYDQVRGERINADVPASEGNQHELDYLGKHRLQSDAPIVTAVCDSSPGPGADLVEDWPEITADDSECVGRHCLRAHASAAAESRPAPGPGADLVEDWCWLGTGGRHDAHTGPLETLTVSESAEHNMTASDRIRRRVHPFGAAVTCVGLNGNERLNEMK